MIVRWKASALDRARPITLYVETSDEAVEKDRALSEDESLSWRGRAPDVATIASSLSKHSEFATGAFIAYANPRMISLRTLDRVERIPAGLDCHEVAASGGNSKATIWRAENDC